MRTKEIIRMIKKLPRDRIVEIRIDYEYYNYTEEKWNPATLLIKDSLYDSNIQKFKEE